MKFFVVFALIAAVASAGVVRPAHLSSEIQEIIAAINSPSTNPATAAALEQMLLDVLGVSVGPAIVDIDTAPIAIGPAIVDTDVSPIAIGPAIVDTEAFPDVTGPVGTGDISVGPAIIDFPLPDGGAVSAPIDVSPVVIGPSPAGASPSLVQIIVNVNAAGASAPAAPVEASPEPVQIVDSAPVVVDPVQIVDSLPAVDPVQIVDVVDPIQIVDVMPTPVVEPVQVVDVVPVVVEPVQIGAPIIPVPAVNLPEELN